MNEPLVITTLGDLTFQIGGETISNFSSRKAEALLLYLAVEKESLHRRESLFTLLWPGMPEGSARNNLRQILYALRQTFPKVGAIDDDETVPLLLSDRNMVQINPEAAVTVDIHQLDCKLQETQLHDHLNLKDCETCIHALKDVVDLYTGEFLRDFYLKDSNQFEEWAETNREAYCAKVLETLEILTEIFIQKADYDQARTYADQQLKIDSLRESARRQMMAILAYNGHRAAALRQYHTCVQILRDELGVAPSTKTILLYEQMRVGTIKSDYTLSITRLRLIKSQLRLKKWKQPHPGYV